MFNSKIPELRSGCKVLGFTLDNGGTAFKYSVKRIMNVVLNQKLKNNWRNINASTIKFAQSVPISNWTSKPFDKRFTTFAWEFACILRTRMCYLRAFRTGKLDFADSAEIPNKKVIEVWEKAEVVEALSNSGREILNEMSKVDGVEMDSAEKLDFANYLFQHERIHQGKLMLYHSLLGLPLPKSFKKTWGEGNFSS